MVTEGETQTAPQGLQGHLNTPGTEGAPAQAALTTLELRASVNHGDHRVTINHSTLPLTGEQMSKGDSMGTKFKMRHF